MDDAMEAEFTSFVVGASRQLLRTAVLITGDSHQAEDVVQTALAKAYLRWPTIRSQDPTGYVRRVVVTSGTDWWRSRPWRERATNIVPEPPPMIDGANQRADQQALRAALAALTHRERCVVVLRYYEGLTEQEIARTLGIAAGTVKSTAARALRKLRISPELSIHDGPADSPAEVRRCTT